MKRLHDFGKETLVNRYNPRGGVYEVQCEGVTGDFPVPRQSVMVRNLAIIISPCVHDYVSDKILFMLYNIRILPNISFCSILWTTTNTLTNSILLLHVHIALARKSIRKI